MTDPPRQCPSIAVITPSFNQGEFLEQTLTSVIQQRYPRLDYRVMDGGSSDQSLEILSRHEGHCRWISAPDGGQAEAINRGFALADGDILGWLNSDDTLAPGALAEVGEFFAEHPEVDLVYGLVDFIDAAGRRIGACAHIEPYDPARLRYYSDFIVQPAAFFRRSTFEAVGGLDASLHYAMDYDLWLKMADAGCRVAHVRRHWANYRWFGGNKSADGGQRRLEEVEQVARRHGLRLPAYFALERVALESARAWSNIRRGQVAEGIRSIAAAMRALGRSPRAVRSLLVPSTWKVIYRGQVLRAHARQYRRTAGGTVTTRAV